jgi:coproporphyrinogen III oxidase
MTTTHNIRTSVKDERLALKERARTYFETLQKKICKALEEIEGDKKFAEDRWEREGGGGGVTKVMEDGAVFEKAGVNVSTVFGVLPKAIAQKMQVQPSNFCATGVSLVIHPRSPMIPTVHANYRYFEHADGDSWFGGGSDLTPYYPYEEDIIHFHETLKKACDLHDSEYYSTFKKWCDEYFFIEHRGEARGVGGIFFDYLRGDGEMHFAFVQSVGDAFLDTYLPIVEKRKSEPWGEKEKAWQLLRRGRYVEFNLVYDRGTTFGLETKGRTESVLMSLPPRVEWKYNMHPQIGSREANLLGLLTNPRDWVSSTELLKNKRSS